jgi:hypothetical protein
MLMFGKSNAGGRRFISSFGGSLLLISALLLLFCKTERRIISVPSSPTGALGDSKKIKSEYKYKRPWSVWRFAPQNLLQNLIGRMHHFLPFLMSYTKGLWSDRSPTDEDRPLIPPQKHCT